jgi:hypothetical protein
MATEKASGKRSFAKARFFLNRLREVESQESFDDLAAEAYLDATLVFIDSALDAMTKKFTRERCSALYADPFFTYFGGDGGQRRVIVHQDKTAKVVHRSSITILAAVAVGMGSFAVGTLSVVPKDPTPWQRVKIRKQAHIDKQRAAVSAKRARERLQRVRARARAESERWARQNPPRRETHIHFESEDDRIAGIPAVEVIDRYLDMMDQTLTTLLSS